MPNSDEKLLVTEVAPTSFGFSAKDEMNLAEFPIALVTDRAPAGEKTIRFQDKIFDERKGQNVQRKVIITASDEYGLPTAKDDEVIVGLIQLTRRSNNFSDRTVHFRRSELIDLLGWPDTGPSYKRLNLSFNRWLGVSLHYENAWWDKQQGQWTSVGFHFIESFKLNSARKGRRNQPDPTPSKFTWNEDLFRSFQSGYLKQLDLNFYLSLTLPTSKRIFRFLDKRFYHRDEWVFDLREFAIDHIGLSRKYEGNTQLSRKLDPAIRELEAKGFLYPLSRERRFEKVSTRKWIVRFLRNRTAATQQSANPIQPEVQSPELIDELTKRGVTPTTARNLTSTYEEKLIREKIASHDWLRTEDDGRVLRNPAGFLVQSIREDYPAPEAFKLKAEAERVSAAQRRKAKLQEEERTKREEAQEAAEREQDDRAQQYWDSLDQNQQETLWNEAINNANEFYLKMYRIHENTGSEAESRWRKILLHAVLSNHIDCSV